jgi:outer membrane receptor for ferrienterochelin and colicins
MLGGAHPAMTAPPTGTIEGVVKDAQGQPMAGVQLTLHATTGRIAKRVTSGPDGRYRLAGIAAGDYSISGAQGGVAAAVAVRAGEHASADLALAAASAAPGRAAAASPATETAPPTPGPLELEELNIVAKRLEAARIAIEPQIGASTYTVTRQAIEAQPGGSNNTLNQVLLQAPGVSQDAESAGGIHVRNEMQPVEFRINGIPLPIGLSYFGQGLSPRFATSFNLITGALPAQYGLTTSGIIDIQTKNGLFAPGGLVSMYGGGYDTLQPSAEYGGSIDGYNYYVSGDFLSTNHGIDGVTPAVAQIHDQSEQLHAFAYLDKIIDGENRLTAIAGLFNGRFEIPNIRPRRPSPG